MGFVTTLPRKDRTQLLASARGIIAEVMPIQQQMTTFTATAGSAFGCLIGLRGGDVITNVHTFLSTASSSGTLIKMALWSTGGTLLASTADMSATFNNASNNASWITGSLSTPYTVPSDGGYAVGIVAVGGTGPTILRALSISGISVPIGSSARLMNTAAGQTDAANVTWAATNTQPYFAVS